MATAKEAAEFLTARQREDAPLFRILWDGHSCAACNDDAGRGDDVVCVEDGTAVVDYSEGVTLAKLLPSLLDDDDDASSSHQKARRQLRAAAALSAHRHVHATTARRHKSPSSAATTQTKINLTSSMPSFPS